MAYTYGKMRFWEILPGLLVWSVFFFSVFFSFFKPIWVIVFIIIFDVLWLFRVMYFHVFVLIAYKRYRKAIKIDWEIERLKIEQTKNHLHLVFLPTYKEGIEIIQTTLNSLKQSSFPKKQLMIILGGEQADNDHFLEIQKQIEKKYSDIFFHILFTIHPKGLPNEIAGKGSNMHWMGLKTEEWFLQNYPNIKDEDVIVSAFDVDTIPHEQYFSYLSYVYATSKNNTRSSYQPVALFSNNIWNVSAPVRVGAFGTTFWLFGELSRSERLWTFSSHSMPWKMLRDVRFWQPDIVSEDSRIFMQAFLHYHGQYRVTPLYLPVSMDAVSEKDFFGSCKALYVQMRRWAWGVEHLPFIVDGFRKDPLIPKLLKYRYLFNHLEGMFTWATAPILMFVLGWLPLYIAKDSPTTLVQAAPFTLEHVMRFAMIGMIVSALLAFTLLPKKPFDQKSVSWIGMLLQWAIIPITFIVFGSFPAIDAQTRFMFGKYLGFSVTKKKRE